MVLKFLAKKGLGLLGKKKTLTVDTNTATSGGISGGGNSCSAGPATLTA